MNAAPEIIRSKVVDVTFKNPDGTSRQALIRKYCRPGMLLILQRVLDLPTEKYSQSDYPNAIAVYAPTGKSDPPVQIGRLKHDLASELAPLMDAGSPLKASISEITGGTEAQKTLGVNIVIEKYPQPVEEPRPVAASLRKAPSSSSNLLNIIIVVLLLLLVGLCCGCMGLFGGMTIFYGSQGLTPQVVITQVSITQVGVTRVVVTQILPQETLVQECPTCAPQPTYTPMPTPEPTLVTPTSSLPATSYVVGEVITFDEHTLVLNSYDFRENLLVANFTAQNTGDRPLTISSRVSFIARRSDGTTLNQEFSDCGEASLDSIIPPNEARTGDICYQGPFEGPVKIFYMPNLFGSIIITWEISPP